MTLTCSLLVFAATITYVVKAEAPSCSPHGRRLTVRFTETDKLFSDDAGDSDRFGSAVAVHGNIAVVGAPYEDENGLDDAGAVHIWRLGEHMGSSSEITRLTAPDPAAHDNFGKSVAMSAHLVIVGAPLRDHASAGPDAGTAFVFRLDNNGIPEGVVALNADDATSTDEFGTSVAISDALVLIGAPFADSAGQQASGAAYIFKTDDAGVSFRFIKRILARDVTYGDNFGTSVGITNRFAIVGAPHNDYNDLEGSGSAYIYGTSDDGETWSSGVKVLANTPSAYAFFGYSVSVCGDLAAIGAYNQRVHGFESAGAVYLLSTDNDGLSWSHVQTLTASDADGWDVFGFSLAMTSNYVVVGAYLDGEVYSNSGAAYVFKAPNGTSFEQHAKLAPSDAANGDWFAYAVSVEGRWVFVGSALEDVYTDNSGAAYSFLIGLDNTTPPEDPLEPSDDDKNSTIGEADDPVRSDDNAPPDQDPSDDQATPEGDDQDPSDDKAIPKGDDREPSDDDINTSRKKSSNNIPVHVIIAIAATAILVFFVLLALYLLDSIQKGESDDNIYHMRLYTRCVEFPIFILFRLLSLLATIWTAAVYALKGTIVAAVIYWVSATMVFTFRCSFAGYVLFWAGYTVKNVDGHTVSKRSKCAWTFLAGFGGSILAEHLCWKKDGTYGGFLGRQNRETFLELGLVILTVVAVVAILITNILAAYQPARQNNGTSLIELIPAAIGDILRFIVFAQEFLKLGKATTNPPEVGQQETKEPDEPERKEPDQEERGTEMLPLAPAN